MGSSYYDLSRTADLHQSNNQANCFHIPRAKAEPLTFNGKVVGDILQGNSVNCELISICPHGYGTHTEGIGHITPEKRSVPVPPPFLNAILVSVQTVNISETNDFYPTKEDQDE